MFGLTVRQERPSHRRPQPYLLQLHTESPLDCDAILSVFMTNNITFKETATSLTHLLLFSAPNDTAFLRLKPNTATSLWLDASFGDAAFTLQPSINGLLLGREQHIIVIDTTLPERREG